MGRIEENKGKSIQLVDRNSGISKNIISGTAICVKSKRNLINFI